MLPPVAIISHAYWQRRFGGSPAAVGGTVTLMGQQASVVGIMPEGFRFLDNADVWLPMRMRPTDARRFHNWLLVGRLKPGVTIAQAQAEIDAISERLARLHPDSNKGKGLHLQDLHEALAENLRPQVLMITAAVALMLLIACGNVANLLLARGVTRRSEMAMRVSLGASRGRLVRQLVTESVTLALLGGGLGLAVAAALQRLLPSLLGLEGSRLSVAALQLDLRVLAFALLISLVTGVAVGLVPALRSTRVALFEDLKGGARTVTSRGGARLRMALVASQVTLSLVLLVGSALLIRSFAKLARVNLGFDPDNLLTAQVALPPTEYPTNEARIQFFTGLLDEIRAIPGVAAAGMVTQLPIQSPGNDIYVWTPDHPPKERGLGQTALTRVALPGYLDAMRMPLVAGRGIQDTDRAGSPPVLVVNETMAKTLFREENPVGRQVVVDMGGDQPVAFEVIGVVADARVSRADSAPYPTMYHSFFQYPRAGLSVVIRTTVDGQQITRALREEARQGDSHRGRRDHEGAHPAFHGPPADPRRNRLCLCDARARAGGDRAVRSPRVPGQPAPA
jgi:putative ABC transport system permease protein